MSFSLRPTLRPVDWSQVDSHGKNIREHAHSQSPFYPPDSPDSDMEVDHDRWPSASTSARASPAGVRSAPPYLSSLAPTSRPSTIGSRPPHASTSAHGYPQHKRAMSFEVPIQYYPPALSPSEMMWRDRFGYLFQKGYQLRPRYSPSWNPMGRGNSRHYHSGEDHIMQIVSLISFPLHASFRVIRGKLKSKSGIMGMKRRRKRSLTSFHHHLRFSIAFPSSRRNPA